MGSIVQKTRVSHYKILFKECLVYCTSDKEQETESKKPLWWTDTSKKWGSVFEELELIMQNTLWPISI